jgi:hypothetical protein
MAWCSVKAQGQLYLSPFHNFYASQNIVRVIKSRRMRWVGYVARMGALRNAYKILVGKPEGYRPSGSSMSGWEDNIRADRREKGWENMD